MNRPVFGRLGMMDMVMNLRVLGVHIVSQYTNVKRI